MSIRKDLEQAHGLPFDKLMARYAAQDLSRKDTARILGISYQALLKLLQRHSDPFEPQDAALRYFREHGETLAAAAIRLSKTHTLHQAAQHLGTSGTSLRKALEDRGLQATFVQRYGAGRQRERSDRYRSYEVNGVRGSLRELTERFASVPLSTVRHRVHGSNWPVEKAVLWPYVEIDNRDANLERIQAGARKAFARISAKRRSRKSA